MFNKHNVWYYAICFISGVFRRKCLHLIWKRLENPTYGESVVEACVEAGAHHLDISGEPQYLEKMQLKYHQVGTSFILRGMALMIDITESCWEWCLRRGSLWIRLYSCRPRSDLCQEGDGGRRQLSGDLPRGPGSRPSWCCNQLCHLPGFIGSMN